VSPFQGLPFLFQLFTQGVASLALGYLVSHLWCWDAISSLKLPFSQLLFQPQLPSQINTLHELKK
jgi:hypothetical protein